MVSLGASQMAVVMMMGVMMMSRRSLETRVVGDGLLQALALAPLALLLLLILGS